MPELAAIVALAALAAILYLRLVALRRRLPAAEPGGGLVTDYQGIFADAVGGIFRTTPDGRVVAANLATARILGYESLQQFLEEAGDIRRFYVDPADRETLLATLAAHEEVRGFELQVNRRDGQVIWISLDAALRRGPDGAPVSLDGLVSDITDRKAAEAANAETQGRYRALIESMPAIIYMDEIDDEGASQGRTVYTSPQAAEILGYPPEAFAETHFLFEGMYHPDDAVRMRRIDEHHRMTGEPVSEDYRMVTATGRIVWIHEESREVQGKDGGRLSQGLLIDITATKEVEELLVEAQASSAATAAKNEFLSRMSHELRTPLNAILGFGQLLETADLSSDDRESVNNMVRAGERLREMIDEILEISRLEAGRRAMSLEPVRVLETVTEAAALADVGARARSVRVVLDVEDAVVLADQEALKQIVLNLLSNAVKLSRQPGTATVLGRVSADRYELSVADEGPGIAPEDRSQVFKPFARFGPAAHRPDIAGPGLGLALAKGLAEAIRADLSFTSEPGRGTTFVLRLLPTDATPLTPMEDAGVPSARARIVLHIEDNPSNVGLVERILAHRPQLDVMSAETGALGLDLARSRKPDIVLLDVNLPDIPGDEVLRRLKADPATRSIPVLVLSAHTSPGRDRRMKEAGATEYLTKPIEVRRFLEAIDDILGSSPAR